MQEKDRGEKRTAGQRSRKLEKAFHSTVKYALRGSPFDEFQTYFPQDSLSSETLTVAFDAYTQVRCCSRWLEATVSKLLTL